MESRSQGVSKHERERSENVDEEEKEEAAPRSISEIIGEASDGDEDEALVQQIKEVARDLFGKPEAGD